MPQRVTARRSPCRTSRAPKSSPPSRNRPTIWNCPSRPTAGTPYHLWVRMRASSNSCGERLHPRAVHQRRHRGDWDHVVARGQPGGRRARAFPGTGGRTTAAARRAWALTSSSPRAGTRRLRIQNREDGFVIDQIVLSSATYLRKSPGTAEERLHDAGDRPAPTGSSWYRLAPTCRPH